MSSAVVTKFKPVAPAPILIEAHDLNKVYETADGEEVTALADVSFSIREGEFVCIVGRSGCGKSTLMKIMAGLLDCTSGSIAINNKPITAPSVDVGIVFQQPVLLPWRTIYQNVIFPVEIRKVNTTEYAPRAKNLLRLVGLEGFEDRYPHELSGGMQQRAAIVRALVQNPKLLLMDEPFGALDAMTREQMNLELMKIWHSYQKTVIFITHSIPESVLLSDRVIAMTPRPGKIAEIIEIDLPRPRTLEMISSDRFGVYASHIRQLLQASEGLD